MWLLWHRNMWAEGYARPSVTHKATASSTPAALPALSEHTDEVELQGPTHMWMLGSPDTDPTAPTTDWNRDDKVFKEGKGTMHWIQDRNKPVQLSLLVK